MFFVEFAAFESCEPLKPHVEYRLSLSLREAENRLQALFSFAGVVSRANRPDYLLNVRQCFLETFDDVFTGFGLFQSVVCPTSHDFTPVVQEYREHFLNAEDFGLVVDESKVNDTES